MYVDKIEKGEKNFVLILDIDNIVQSVSSFIISTPPLNIPILLILTYIFTIFSNKFNILPTLFYLYFVEYKIIPPPSANKSLILF